MKGKCLILFVFLVHLLFGCVNSPEAIREYSVTGREPLLWVDSLYVLYTEHGRLVAEVYAREMRNTERSGGAYDEFPKGIHVRAYDDSGALNSMMRANYAIYDREKRKWDARYRVVAVNTQGDSIQTEQIFWDENEARIYTSANVRVRTKDALLFGRGFESDDRLLNWEIKEPTGVISVPNPGGDQGMRARE